MRVFVFSGMALIAATYGLARFGYGLFLPRFTETFQLSSVISGAIQAGSFLAFCLAAILAMRLGARPRLVVSCAGATAALGAVGVAASPHVAVFAVSVMVAGAGAGFATPGLVALVRRNVAPQRQENAQTIVNAGTGAGIVVAGMLMFLTVEQWRVGWWAIGALVAAACVATLWSDRSRSGRTSDGGSAGSPGQEAAGASGAGLRGMLSMLAWPIAAGVLAGASSAAIWTFGRSIMADSSAGDQAYSILAWIVLGAAGVLGALAGRIAKASSVAVAWNLTTVAMGASTVVLGAAPGMFWTAFPAVAVFGASYTAVCGVLIIWASRIVPDRAAAGTAVLFIALAVGQAAGSLLLGALLGLGTPLLAFGVAGALGLLAVLPALRRSGSESVQGGRGVPVTGPRKPWAPSGSTPPQALFPPRSCPR